MITKIVPIGNSKGIRLPNYILKEMNIDSQIEITMNKNEIISRPILKPRTGWSEAFKNMSNNSDDNLIINDSIDLNDWEW